MILRWFRRRTARLAEQAKAEPEPPRKPRARPTLPDPMMPETFRKPIFSRRER